MRALEILQDAIAKNLVSVHSQRQVAVWRAVKGLMGGGRLWLTGLGRDLPGRCSDKHRIKAVDRLIGGRLHVELPDYYRAVASWLLQSTKHPTLLVDWTGVGSKYYALSAALSFSGRAIPIFSRVFEKHDFQSTAANKEFLDGLAVVVPDHCMPVIVTDAGFHSSWFNAVTDKGWDFVGRIRNATKAKVDGEWIPAKSLHARATKCPTTLGKLWLYKSHPQQFLFVLSKARKSKGRQRKTTKGTLGRNTVDKTNASQAREPWLLVTSLSSNAKAIIGIYKSRMQIEESFRDLKNHRHGWALEDVGCRTPQRVEVLLMLAALANVAMQIVGLAAEILGLQRNFQSNTIRNRRVLSLLVLAKMVLQRGPTIPRNVYKRARSKLYRIIAAASPSSSNRSP